MMTFSKEHFRSRPEANKKFMKKLLDNNEDDSGFKEEEDCPQGKFLAKE
jgi:hypothetical protein